MIEPSAVVDCRSKLRICHSILTNKFCQILFAWQIIEAGHRSSYQHITLNRSLIISNGEDCRNLLLAMTEKAWSRNRVIEGNCIIGRNGVIFAVSPWLWWFSNVLYFWSCDPLNNSFLTLRLSIYLAAKICAKSLVFSQPCWVNLLIVAT